MVVICRRYLGRDRDSAEDIKNPNTDETSGKSVPDFRQNIAGIMVDDDDSVITGMVARGHEWLNLSALWPRAYRGAHDGQAAQ